MNATTMRRFNASRGGHAPGHLREALGLCLEHISQHGKSPHDWLKPLAKKEALVFFNERMQARWDKMSLRERGIWLTGQLWNCTDVLPGIEARYLAEKLEFYNLGEEVEIHTWGMLARLLRREFLESLR